MLLGMSALEPPPVLRWPLRRRALTLAAVIFCVEVLIATRFAHWRWVRGSLGDYLVVFLLYLPALAWRPWPARRLATTVFILAVIVECAQALHLAERLGLAPGSVGHTVVGATFSWGDVLMYALGCVTCFWVDRRFLRPRGLHEVH